MRHGGSYTAATMTRQDLAAPETTPSSSQERLCCLSLVNEGEGRRTPVKNQMQIWYLPMPNLSSSLWVNWSPLVLLILAPSP